MLRNFFIALLLTCVVIILVLMTLPDFRRSLFGTWLAYDQQTISQNKENRVHVKLNLLEGKAIGERNLNQEGEPFFQNEFAVDYLMNQSFDASSPNNITYLIRDVLTSTNDWAQANLSGSRFHIHLWSSPHQKKGFQDYQPDLSQSHLLTQESVQKPLFNLWWPELPARYIKPGQHWDGGPYSYQLPQTPSGFKPTVQLKVDYSLLEFKDALGKKTAVLQYKGTPQLDRDGNNPAPKTLQLEGSLEGVALIDLQTGEPLGHGYQLRHHLTETSSDLPPYHWTQWQALHLVKVSEELDYTGDTPDLSLPKIQQ